MACDSSCGCGAGGGTIRARAGDTWSAKVTVHSAELTAGTDLSNWSVTLRDAGSGEKILDVEPGVALYADGSGVCVTLTEADTTELASRGEARSVFDFDDDHPRVVTEYPFEVQVRLTRTDPDFAKTVSSFEVIAWSPGSGTPADDKGR